MALNTESALHKYKQRWLCTTQVSEKNIFVSMVAKGNYLFGDNSVRPSFAYVSVQLFTIYPGLNVQNSKIDLFNDYNTIDEITQKFDSHLSSKDATDCFKPISHKVEIYTRSYGKMSYYIVIRAPEQAKGLGHHTLLMKHNVHLTIFPLFNSLRPVAPFTNMS